MLKKAVLGIVFLAAFFSTAHFSTQYLKSSDSNVAGLNWGAGVEVAHARGK